MKFLKKMLVLIIGGILLVAGLAMIVLPGPAFVVIPTALAILAIEFVCARRWLAWLRQRLNAFTPSRTGIESARKPNPPILSPTP
jgi:uncharacterized protein (TIGR02611 family)